MAFKIVQLEDTVIDPASGIEVDAETPGAIATHAGEVCVFCSEGCKDHFESDPEKYVGSYDHTLHLSHIDDVRTQRIPTPEGSSSFELSVAQPGELSAGDEVTYTRRITDEHVQQFAEISGDTNALHPSDSFAQRTGFGRRIVHGALVSGSSARHSQRSPV